VFAVQFDRFGPPDVLHLGSAPEPHAGAGEIRIRVRTSGVSPVDVALRAGTSPSKDRIALPHVVGIDAAGVVDEVGADVNDVVIGDEVFGAVNVAAMGGASAEYAVLKFWARRPSSMTWEEAGAAGTSVETATRVLDMLDLHAGMSLLVDGAAGGVGSTVVQLAVARRVRVIGTGSPANQRFIGELGATALEYGDALADRVREQGFEVVDRALDVAGAGSLSELIAITGSAESTVTIADFTAATHGVRISLGTFGGQPSGEHGLATAASLTAEGKFRMRVQAAFDMTHAAQAHDAASRAPRQGKIVLVAPEQQSN
jgi:NADPH:quinone reductase-like Zn-dependent oxidoreductase